MASPVDAGRAVTPIATAADPWTVNYPGSIAAGDLLILFAKAGGSVSSAIGQSPVWTSLVSADLAGADSGVTNIWYRVATGSEGATFSLDLLAAQKGAAIVWRITGAADPATRAPEITAAATFTTTANTANPASISPTGGSKDYLFLITVSCDGETQTFSHGAYANVVNTDSGTAGAVTSNFRISGGSRQATTATEDPAAFTHAAASSGGSAFTIAIHPAAAGAAPGPAFSRQRRASRFLTTRGR